MQTQAEGASAPHSRVEAELTHVGRRTTLLSARPPGTVEINDQADFL